MNVNIVGIVAVISLILSVFSFFHTKLETRIEFLTNKRYDWLSMVRGYFDSFTFGALQMQEYDSLFEDDSSIALTRNVIEEMKKLQNKLSMLMNFNGKYESLIDILTYRIISLSSKKIDFLQVYTSLSDCESKLESNEDKKEFWKNYRNVRICILNEDLRESDYFVRSILNNKITDIMNNKIPDMNSEEFEKYKGIFFRNIINAYNNCNLELNFYINFLTIMVKNLLKIEWNRIKGEMKKLRETSSVDSDDKKFDLVKNYLKNDGKNILNSKQSEQAKAMINEIRSNFVKSVNFAYNSYTNMQRDRRRASDNNREFLSHEFFEATKRYLEISNRYNININSTVHMILEAIDSFLETGKIFENISELNKNSSELIKNSSEDKRNEVVLRLLIENKIEDEIIKTFKDINELSFK